jgi:hypothetical protein
MKRDWNRVFASPVADPATAIDGLPHEMWRGFDLRRPPAEEPGRGRDPA